jgi:hypothetical protein
MEASRNLYLKQKGIKGYEDLRKYSTIITITEVNQKGSVIFFKEKENTYSYKIDFRNGEWEKYLKVGNNVRMFIIERQVKDKIYLNAYPDHYSSKVLFSDDDL